MNNDLISRSALKEELDKLHWTPEYGFTSRMYIDDIIDNAPTVKPCDNCDLYFTAMTKEEMKEGGEK